MTEAPPELTAADLARLAIFPLPNVTLFPGAALPLHVFEPRYLEMTRDVLAGKRLLAIARLRPGFEATYEGRPPVFDTCCVGWVVNHTARPDGRYDITLRGLSRVRIVRELPADRSYRLVQAERLRDAPGDPALITAWQTKLGSLWQRLAPHLPPPVRDLRALTRDTEGAGAYSDRLAAAIVADPGEAQSLLEELDPAERLRLLVQRLQELLYALAPEKGSAPLN